MGKIKTFLGTVIRLFVVISIGKSIYDSGFKDGVKTTENIVTEYKIECDETTEEDIIDPRD